MFGYHKVRKERKRLQKERKSLENFPHEENEERQVSERVKRAGEERKAAREGGRKYAEEFIHRDVQGLTPEKRNALQYEANKNIQRDLQSSRRRLLGEQGRRGIVGRGGVGYAQERDLDRMGREAKGQVHRDLDKLNSDLALKKMAAMFNIEQGEASQAHLDRQAALDDIRHQKERKRQRKYEDRFNRIFSRI